MATTQEMNAMEIAKIGLRMLYIQELEANQARLLNEKHETHKALRSIVRLLEACQGGFQAIQAANPNGNTAATLGQRCEEAIAKIDKILDASIYTRDEPADPREGEPPICANE